MPHRKPHRYEQILSRTKPGSWPSAVAILACRVKWNNLDGGQWQREAELAEWRVQLVEKTAAGYALTRSATGATADGFWDTIREGNRHTRRLWVICDCSRVAMAVLGLWGKVEDGEITLAGNETRTVGAKGIALPSMSQDDGSSCQQQQPTLSSVLQAMRTDSLGGTEQGRHKGTKRKRDMSRGIMILEDPPIVLELQWAGTQNKLVWVDAANYGIGSSDPTGDIQSRTLRLAEWFRRAASTLHNVGPCGWCHTAATQAKHLWSTSYLDHIIYSHRDKVATDIETAALFGGRCEAFCIGSISGPVHLLDFRSLYPSICAVEPLPVRLVRTGTDRSDMERALSTKGLFVIAEVYLETDEPDYPYRQVVNAKTGASRVVYPVGRYRTHLAQPELLDAMRAGCVRYMRRYAVYESDTALARYATTLYAARCAADAARDADSSAFIKRLMVSICGKFAQRDRKWVPAPRAELDAEYCIRWVRGPDGMMTRYRAVAGITQREETGGYCHGAVPAISVAIASYGRARLLSALRCAGREHSYYCDTDSLLLGDYGRENLCRGGWINNGEWGYLQDYGTATGCVVLGAKAYEIGTIRKCSGRPAAGHARAEQPGTYWHGPTVAESLAASELPSAVQRLTTYNRGDGRYASAREPGGWVKPIVIEEW